MRIILFILLALCLAPSHAHAQKFGIVAVVNGEAITNYALHDRVTLMIRTSGLQNSPTIREKLTGQALQALINEALQRQDAKVQGISVSDADLARAITDIEKKNGVAPGGFRNHVAKAGIEPDSLYEQIRMQILWRKILARKVQPHLAVSDFEVNDAMAQHGGGTPSTSKSSRPAEVYLSEIVLPIPRGQEAETLQVAQQLISELKAGKDFGKIATQFSSGSTAENGGLIGWINEDQLRGSLRTHVKEAKPNTLLPPIEAEDGYHIIKLGERRTFDNITKKAPVPTVDKVKNMLLSQKLDLESKRYMKQLHDKSFIEIRG